jgi:hypothetical protein
MFHPGNTRGWLDFEGGEGYLPRLGWPTGV